MIMLWCEWYLYHINMYTTLSVSTKLESNQMKSAHRCAALPFNVVTMIIISEATSSYDESIVLIADPINM
jgi:hypothetical protein